MPQELDDKPREVGEGAGTRATEYLRAHAAEWAESARVALGLWHQAREQIGGAEIGDGPLQWAGRVRAIIERYRLQSNENRDSLHSLERLYARALDRIGTLEATLTAAQARNGELVEEVRYLKKNRDEWKSTCESSWATVDCDWQAGSWSAANHGPGICGGPGVCGACS
jgi:hypothetical protein